MSAFVCKFSSSVHISITSANNLKGMHLSVSIAQKWRFPQHLSKFKVCCKLSLYYTFKYKIITEIKNTNTVDSKVVFFLNNEREKCFICSYKNVVNERKKSNSADIGLVILRYNRVLTDVMFVIFFYK